MVLSMIGQYFNDMISKEGGRIKISAFLDRGEFDVVFVVFDGVEESALIFQVVGVIKSIGDRHAVDMPFSGVIGPVADWCELLRKKNRPVLTDAFVSSP